MIYRFFTSQVTVPVTMLIWACLDGRSGGGIGNPGMGVVFRGWSEGMGFQWKHGLSDGDDPGDASLRA